MWPNHRKRKKLIAIMIILNKSRHKEGKKWNNNEMKKKTSKRIIRWSYDSVQWTNKNSIAPDFFFIPLLSLSISSFSSLPNFFPFYCQSQFYSDVNESYFEKKRELVEMLSFVDTGRDMKHLCFEQLIINFGVDCPRKNI